MEVKELHRHLKQHFTAFFEDFNYYKIKGEQSIFKQERGDCHQLIFLNMSDYQDGLMLEFVLGTAQPTIEHRLSELLGRSNQGLQQLTYHIFPEALDNSLPKRSFLNPSESTEHYIQLMEAFFVNAGFYWLDEYAHTKKLSDMMALSLVKGRYQSINLLLGTLRSLLLKQHLGESITEDLFFTYLEVMQENGVPEKEIATYISCRKYFIPR